MKLFQFAEMREHSEDLEKLQFYTNLAGERDKKL